RPLRHRHRLRLEVVRRRSEAVAVIPEAGDVDREIRRRVRVRRIRIRGRLHLGARRVRAAAEPPALLRTALELDAGRIKALRAVAAEIAGRARYSPAGSCRDTTAPADRSADCPAAR